MQENISTISFTMPFQIGMETTEKILKNDNTYAIVRMLKEHASDIYIRRNRPTKIKIKPASYVDLDKQWPGQYRFKVRSEVVEKIKHTTWFKSL